MLRGKFVVFTEATSWRTSQIIVFTMDFLGDVRVFLAIQLTENYRFVCEFVLKYYSN